MSKKTKNPVVWARFLAWKMQFWWNYKCRLGQIFLRDFTRFGCDSDWRIPPSWTLERYNRRLWWYNKLKRYGWLCLFSHLRKFAKYSHKCEFTDREVGLLYGGPGAGMDELFEQFVENICAKADGEIPF